MKMGTNMTCCAVFVTLLLLVLATLWFAKPKFTMKSDGMTFNWIMAGGVASAVAATLAVGCYAYQTYEM